MRRVARGGPWILGLSLLAASSSLRAAGSLDPPDLSRYLDWGPLRARPGILLTNVGYDDNILAVDEPRVGDYTATVSPRLEGLLLFGHRAFLTFDERIELTGYLHNGSQNYANQRGNGRLTLPVRSLGVFVDFGLNRVKDRPVDRQDLRPERRDTLLGPGLILQPGWRTEIEIAHATSDWSYTDPDDTGAEDIGERLDRTEIQDSLRATYHAFGRTRLLLDLLGKHVDFDSLTDGTDKDSRERSVLAGVDFGEGGSLSGTLRTGWTSIDSRDPSLRDFSGVVADGEVAYRPLSRTTLRFGALRQPGLTVSGNTIYFLETRFRLRAIYYLNRVFGFDAGTSLGKLSFPSPAGGGPERVDHLVDWDAALRLRLAENELGRRVEYALRFGRYNRDSTIDDLDLSRNTFGIDAVVGF